MEGSTRQVASLTEPQIVIVVSKNMLDALEAVMPPDEKAHPDLIAFWTAANKAIDYWVETTEPVPLPPTAA